MAKAKNNPNQTTKITRVKARDDKKPDTKPTPKKEQVSINGGQGEPKKRFRLLRSFLGYFKGAWVELRQVRWPNRRATLSMTAALLIFTGIFAGFILLVDIAFENLFKLILG